MTNMDLLKAFGKIDNSFIDEAEETAKRPILHIISKNKKVFAIGMVASFCIAIGATVIIASNVLKAPDNLVKPTSVKVTEPSEKPTVAKNDEKSTEEKTKSTEKRATEPATQKSTIAPTENSNVVDNHQVPNDNIEAPTKNSEAAVPVPDWNNLMIAEQYRILDCNGNKYLWCDVKLEAEKIGNILCENATLTGYDVYNNIYTSYGTVYEVKGISNRCVVAVKFPNDDTYYAYDFDVDYKPESLGQIIDDYNLYENMELYENTVHYEKWNKRADNIKELTKRTYNFSDKNMVFNTLLSNRSVTVNYGGLADMVDQWNEQGYESISIGVDISFRKVENRYLTVYENGYVLTGAFTDAGMALYVGEDKCTEFINYVKNSCAMVDEEINVYNLN